MEYEWILENGTQEGEGELEFYEDEEVFLYTVTYVLADGRRAKLRWKFEPLEVKRRGVYLDPSEYPMDSRTPECIWTDGTPQRS